MACFKVIFTAIGLLISQEVLFAQSHFDDFLKDQGLTFKKPNGYQLVVVDDDNDFFDYTCIRLNGRSDNVLGDFHLLSADKSVAITILDLGYVEMDGILSPYWYDENKMFYDNALTRADTTKLPLRFYNSKELQILNADGASEFTQNCDVPTNTPGYLGNRSIYISKAYQGSFKLVYLFKDPNVANQNKIIRETIDMFKYTVNKPKIFIGKHIFEKHYITVDKTPKVDTLTTRWNRGSIYKNLYYFNREQYAFIYEDVILSMQFPANKEWPYYNKEQRTQAHFEKWEKANKDFKKYLTLSRKSPNTLSAERLSNLGADEGYTFDFEHPDYDLYRDEYANCIVILLHKKNVGTILLKYYYKGDRSKAEKAIAQSWGMIKFKSPSFFSENADAIFPY